MNIHRENTEHLQEYHIWKESKESGKFNAVRPKVKIRSQMWILGGEGCYVVDTN